MGTEHSKPKIRIRIKATGISEVLAFLGTRSCHPWFQVFYSVGESSLNSFR